MAKRTSWGFDPKLIDTSVRPQDDFYHYAVGTWLKNTKIPESESRWGSFQVLRLKTAKQLHTLLKETEALKKVTPGTPEQMVRDMFRSGMDMKRRNALGTAPMEPVRKKVASIKNQEDLQRVIAELDRLGVAAPWSLYIDQDMKNADRYQLQFFQGGMGLPERDYYLKQDAEQVRVRTAYEAHIEAILKLAGYKADTAREARATIMQIETRLAKVALKREDFRDPEKTYHKHTIPALAKLAPAVDWPLYLKRIGAEVRDVNVIVPKFMEEVNAMLADVSLEDWKTYLDWHVISDFSGMLSSKFVNQNFEFYGKVLSGAQKMQPLWRRVLGTVNGVAGELVGQMYVKKYFSPEAKKKVLMMFADFTTAYEARIRALDWMTPPTKKKAIAKLHAMTRKIGYPDKWRSYKGLVIRPDDYAGNILRAGEFEFKRALRKLAKPVDRTEWYDYPQTVNAFYSPSFNDMLFPAAFLQHPFFELTADDAFNYGAVGMAIGHEMTHGFDNQGALYDLRGNVKNWWLPEDKKRFEAKAQVIKKQFDAFVVEGLNVNGKLTLGENIADLGGLLIAYDAYQLLLARTGRTNIDGFTPEQRFFLAYVLSEHELSRPEARKLQILTNEHAPSVCRVNGPLSNMTEFYEAWGVKKGDKLYKDPAKRAKIW
ncbi:MAG TPA: M13 family metallopeptidase [Candidatus Paceibacterota bacterium]|nr:M13 family metallopeptidase [Candidatus Paceibacterota bacterium]